MPPRQTIYGLVPPLIAGTALVLEAPLTRAFNHREAMLPVVLFVLLSAILHPRLRNLVIVTLCYGVAGMALRDAFSARSTPMPPEMDYLVLDTARPVVLLFVAALALASAIGETRQPGTVWARRCYFGAAALYFTGIGLINIGWHSSWRGYMLFAIGLIAAKGCFSASRIVASERAEDEAEKAFVDSEYQLERNAAHRRTLQAKEWHDPIETLRTGASQTLPEMH